MGQLPVAKCPFYVAVSSISSERSGIFFFYKNAVCQACGVPQRKKQAATRFLLPTPTQTGRNEETGGEGRNRKTDLLEVKGTVYQAEVVAFTQWGKKTPKKHRAEEQLTNWLCLSSLLGDSDVL